jgi:hypothetical protein
VLSDVEIDDLRLYFEAQFASKQTVKVLNRSGYWSRLETLAPRLRIEDRVRLYSFLWGGLEQFNDVYRRLYATLESLDFPDEAFCAIEALEPRETSIINVKALKGILDQGNDNVNVRSPSGAVRAIPRSHLTAIVAELVMQIKDHPWPFFDYTDLLDFPGARAREMNRISSRSPARWRICSDAARSPTCSIAIARTTSCPACCCAWRPAIRRCEPCLA